MVKFLKHIALGITLICVHFSVKAQDLIILTQNGGDTYLYQPFDIKGSTSWDIFRKDANGSYKKLNTSPIKSVQDGYTFRDAIGRTAYEELAKNIGTESPMATYLTMKNDRDLAAILTFTNVEAAKALGYLFVDETTEINKNYNYKIVFKKGTQSTAYDSIMVDYSATIYQADQPQDVTLEVANENELTIDWRYPSSSKNQYVNGFNIYAEKSPDRPTKMNENLILKTNQDKFSYTFDKPLEDGTYKFYLKATDMTGQESASSAVIEKILSDQTAPSAVDGLVANSYNGSAPTITWRVSLANDLMGYNIYRAPRTIDDFEKVNNELLPPYENYYTDKNVTAGQKYAYAITAVDSSGNESEIINKTSVFIEDYVATDAPNNLTAVYDQEAKTVELSWDFAFEAEDFRTFLITRQIDSENRKGNAETVNLKALRETRFSDSGPTGEGFISGYVYRYNVVAIDAYENRSETTAITFQIPDLEPPQPPEIQAVNDDGHRINLSWTASPDYDVIAYNVYRNKDGKDTLLTKNHYSERLYRDETAEVGNSYIYTITAIDSLGNEGPPSKADTVLMRDNDPPAATRNVYASATEQMVQLSWEQVPDNDLVGYLIYKSNIATGIYEKIFSDPIQKTNYIDADGRAGDWYKVKGIDSSGNEAYVPDGVQAVKRDIE